jgi:hypothetical protein
LSSSNAGRPIMVGIDGSTSALHAALWAADEAAPRHVPLPWCTAAAPSPSGTSEGSPLRRASSTLLREVDAIHVRRRSQIVDLARDAAVAPRTRRRTIANLMIDC